MREPASNLRNLMSASASAPEARRSDWYLFGACREHSWLSADDWFPLDMDSLEARAARVVCRDCPVQRPCLREALNKPTTVGIWGGLDERERRVLLRRGWSPE